MIIRWPFQFRSRVCMCVYHKVHAHTHKRACAVRGKHHFRYTQPSYIAQHSTRLRQETRASLLLAGKTAESIEEFALACTVVTTTIAIGAGGNPREGVKGVVVIDLTNGQDTEVPDTPLQTG